MSWDVFLIKTETNAEKDILDITDVIPFQTEMVRNVIVQGFPDTDCHDRSWLILTRPTFAIEFILGKEETKDTITLFLRGNEGSVEVVAYLCKMLDCRAIDCQTSDFFEMERGDSFNQWRQFRDNVLEQYKE